MRKLKQKPHCDPIALGSRCWECPLYENGKHQAIPVPGELSVSALSIVAEAPGRNEEYAGKPLVGQSGRLVEGALAAIGLERNNVSLHNTLLCRPPKEFTPDQWRQAIEACRPRLEKELQEASPKVILATGNRALQALAGKANVTPWYGAPLPTKYGPVLPAVHPAFCLRKPAMIPVFKRWVARAWGLATVQLKPWQWGELIISDDADISGTLIQLLKANKPIGVDIENFGDPLFAEMFCIGVGNEDVAISFPWGRVCEEPVDSALRAILTGPVPLVLHNASHDVLALKHKGFPVTAPIEDTLLMHAVVAPQLSHKLTDVAAFELHADRWKTTFRVSGDDKGLQLFKTAWEKKRPAMLLYNCKDTQGTARLLPPLKRQLAETHRGQELYDNYRTLDKIAMRMREYGVKVATENMAVHKANFGGELASIQESFTSVGFPAQFTLGKDGEHPSLRKLFFDEFKVEIFSRTPEGAPSLDKKALEKYGTQQDLAGRTARMVLGFRRTAKLLQDYVERLPLDFENVVHPYWRVFGTRTGRWSATGPAFQTIPAGKKKGSVSLRNLFCARPGRFLVAADYEALEARIMATVYGGSKLLEWFSLGIDVHLRHAQIIFGAKSQSKKQCSAIELLWREMAKTVLYALAYGSQPETIWATMVLENPKLELAAVRLVYDKLMEIHADLAETQKLHLEICRHNSYVEERVSGRRQYYHNGSIVPTECLNFPIQGFAGTLANRAVIGIANELRPGEELLAQVHDEIMLEGPDPERLAGMLRKHMSAPINAYGKVLQFPVEVSEGTNWGELRKVA